MSARQIGSHFEMWSWTVPIFTAMKETENAVNSFAEEVKAAREQARTPHTRIFGRNIFSQQIEIGAGINALLLPKEPLNHK